jgi:hypothetical protein
MVDLIQILSQEGNSIVKQIQSNLSSSGNNATSKTSKSLRYEVLRDGTKAILQVIGRPYFMVVETGRKATPDKKPSKGMVDNIKEWLQAKGKPQGLAWAVATAIQKKGTKLHQSGGRTDIVSNVINESRISKIEQIALQAFAKDFLEQLVTLFKDGNNRT